MKVVFNNNFISLTKKSVSPKICTIIHHKEILVQIIGLQFSTGNIKIIEEIIMSKKLSGGIECDENNAITLLFSKLCRSGRKLKVTLCPFLGISNPFRPLYCNIY